MENIIVAGAGVNEWIIILKGIIRQFGDGDGVVNKGGKSEVSWIAGCGKVQSVC